jgi:hypothetical protein
VALTELEGGSAAPQTARWAVRVPRAARGARGSRGRLGQVRSQDAEAARDGALCGGAVRWAGSRVEKRLIC